MISAQTRSWFLKTGYTGNENPKSEFGSIFLDCRAYTIAHQSDVSLSRVSIAKSISLGPTGPARTVRGKRFRSVTAKNVKNLQFDSRMRAAQLFHEFRQFLLELG